MHHNEHWKYERYFGHFPHKSQQRLKCSLYICARSITKWLLLRLRFWNAFYKWQSDAIVDLIIAVCKHIFHIWIRNSRNSRTNTYLKCHADNFQFVFIFCILYYIVYNCFLNFLIGRRPKWSPFSTLTSNILESIINWRSSVVVKSIKLYVITKR